MQQMAITALQDSVKTLQEKIAEMENVDGDTMKLYIPPQKNARGRLNVVQKLQIKRCQVSFIIY